MQDFRSRASQAQRAPLRHIMGNARFPLSQTKSKWGNFASNGSIINHQCLAGSLALSWVWAAQLGVHPHGSEHRRRPHFIHFTLPGSSLWGDWASGWTSGSRSVGGFCRALELSGAQRVGHSLPPVPSPPDFSNTFPAAAGQWTHPLDLRSTQPRTGRMWPTSSGKAASASQTRGTQTVKEENCFYGFGPKKGIKKKSI